MFEKFNIEREFAMAQLQLTHTNLNEDLSPPEISYGRITFEKQDKNGQAGASIIVGGSDFLFLANRKDTAGEYYPEEGCFSIKNYGNFGIGTKYPSKNVKLDINGIMKLKVQNKPPVENEVGMIAIADGRADGWDPKGSGTNVPYPVFFNGIEWKSFC